MMHRERMALPPAVWADLDAMVLEEMGALDGADRWPAGERSFRSDDDFLAQAIAYLRERDDPLRLIEALSGELRPAETPILQHEDDQPEPEGWAAVSDQTAPSASTEGLPP